MTEIHVQIPEKKIPIYVGRELHNETLQVGINVAVNEARKGIRKATLSADNPIHSYEDKLRQPNRMSPINFVVDSSIYDNELVLKSEDGVIVYLLGCEIDVTQKNNIKATALVNRSGSVKERIQQEDYDVKVHGMVMAENGVFPHEAMKQLVSVLKSTSSLECSSVYLDIFGITRLAFKDAKFNQKGVKYFNVFPFELSFDSDVEYDFLVEE